MFQYTRMAIAVLLYAEIARREPGVRVHDVAVVLQDSTLMTTFRQTQQAFKVGMSTKGVVSATPNDIEAMATCLLFKEKLDAA